VTAIEKISNLADGGRFDASDRMDYSKVDALGQGTKYDVCASTASSRQVSGAQGIGDVLKGGLCHSFTPDGRCVSLFKTLYTNACGHQCNYCPNGAGCQKKGAIYSYEPEELAKITLTLYKGNYIEGLFLSSGIGGDENETMEKMIETVELLRTKYMFNGYVHLKILPGASDDHIKHAMGLADRVSINLEAVSESYMKELSPTKDYKKDILQKQRTIRDLSRKNRLPAGQTTQMVVGAVGESDKEIFQRCIYEYNEIQLKRVYYSVFTPIVGTEFEDREKQPLWREHRLYQMDWLLRVYNLPKKEIEIAFNDAGFLADMDPKMAIARQTLDSPVDPNTAEYDELLRVPGIGPVSAERIMLARGTKKITKSRELSALGVRINRAKAFLELNGWRDATLMRWLT
jgi:putative DNA modification/repair radical SAM protein